MAKEIPEVISDISLDASHLQGYLWELQPRSWVSSSPQSPWFIFVDHILKRRARGDKYCLPQWPGTGADFNGFIVLIVHIIFRPALDPPCLGCLQCGRACFYCPSWKWVSIQHAGERRAAAHSPHPDLVFTSVGQFWHRYNIIRRRPLLTNTL